MNRYEAMFSRLAQRNEGAFIPFVVIGDPNLEASFEIIQTLIDSGADALELGLAFSDPVADGPVIQRADMRVISSGIKMKQAMDLLGRVREQNPSIAFGILTYANLVVHRGADRFYGMLHDSGVDSLLIADVPTIEMGPFLDCAKKHEIQQVFIVPPNIDEDRLRYIAQHSGGYVYVVTRSGVTGANLDLELSSQGIFGRLRDLRSPPGIYGFGISSPDHVSDAMKAGASGAISGSAITAIIEQNLDDTGEMLKKIAAFTEKMKAATLKK